MSVTEMGPIVYYDSGTVRQNFPLVLGVTRAVTIVMDVVLPPADYSYGQYLFEYGLGSANNKFYFDTASWDYGPNFLECADRTPDGWNIVVFPKPTTGVRHRYVWRIDRTKPSTPHSLWIDGVKLTHIQVNNNTNYNVDIPNQTLYMGQRWNSTSGQYQYYGGVSTPPQFFNYALSDEEARQLSLIPEDSEYILDGRNVYPAFVMFEDGSGRLMLEGDEQSGSDLLIGGYNAPISYSLEYSDALLGLARKYEAGTAPYHFTYNPASFILSKVLPADTATYQLTGVAQNFRATRKLDLGTGQFNLAFSDAAMRSGISIFIDTTNYTSNMSNAVLNRTAKLNLDTASYSLTGTDVDLQSGFRFIARGGEYHLESNNTFLKRKIISHLETGSYTFNYNDVAFWYGKKLSVDSGNFALGFSDLRVERELFLRADSVPYTLTTPDQILGKNFVFGVDSSSYVFSYSGSDFYRGLAVKADIADYDISANVNAVLVERYAPLDTSAYLFDEPIPPVTVDRRLFADHIPYLSTVSDAALNVERHLIADAASYQTTYSDARIYKTLIMRCLPISYNVSVPNQSIVADRGFQLDTGDYTMQNNDVGIYRIYRLSGKSKIKYNLNVNDTTFIKESILVGEGANYTLDVGNSGLIRNFGDSYIIKVDIKSDNVIKISRK